MTTIDTVVNIINMFTNIIGVYVSAMALRYTMEIHNKK